MHACQTWNDSSSCAGFAIEMVVEWCARPFNTSITLAILLFWPCMSSWPTLSGIQVLEEKSVAWCPRSCIRLLNRQFFDRHYVLPARSEEQHVWYFGFYIVVQSLKATPTLHRVTPISCLFWTTLCECTFRETATRPGRGVAPQPRKMPAGRPRV